VTVRHPTERSGRVLALLRTMFRWWAVVSLTSAAVALITKRLADTVADPRAPAFGLVSVFDGHEHRPVTNALASSRSVTMFSGTRIDLRRCQIAESPVRLRLITVFGACDVVVPDTWHVTVGGVTAAGGCDVRVTPDQALPPEAPELVVGVFTLFGGVSVTARPVLAAAEAG